MAKANGLTLKVVLIESAIAQVGLDGAKESAGSVSQHLLQVAQTFQNVKEFLAECKVQETYLKSDAGKAEMRGVFQKHGLGEFDATIPRCWTQAKANIKAAWSRGLAPTKFSTESEMRKELNKVRKQDTDTGESRARLDVTKLDGEVYKIISRTVANLAKLPVEEQRKLALLFQPIDKAAMEASAAMLANAKPEPIAPPRVDAGQVVNPATTPARKGKGKKAA
jgi:hypothetical protein